MSEAQGNDAGADDGIGRSTVIGWVATWIVAGVLAVSESVVGSISAIYDSLINVIGIALDQIATAGSVILSGPALLLDVVETTVVSVASSAGPFAPVVIVALWAVIAVALVVALRNLPRVVWYVYQVIPGT